MPKSRPECLGDQGGRVLFPGGSHEPCMRCSVFEKCHKLSIATYLAQISTDVSLATENAMARGWLLSQEGVQKLYREKCDGPTEGTCAECGVEVKEQEDQDEEHP